MLCVEVIEIQGEQLLLANGQDSKRWRYGIVGFVDVREDLDARYSIATLGIFGLDMGTMAWMGKYVDGEARWMGKRDTEFFLIWRSHTNLLNRSKSV